MPRPRVRRAVLIGAESTGKTTLCAQLASHYNAVWVAEYGREHREKKIAEEQQRRDNESAGPASRVLICDASAFATVTWFERYAGTRRAQVEALGARGIAELYFIASPDVSLLQDGVRGGERIRDWMHARIEELIGGGGTPYILATGPWQKRLAQAIAAIDARLAQTPPPRHD